jgi:hypothetical protein
MTTEITPERLWAALDEMTRLVKAHRETGCNLHKAVESLMAAHNRIAELEKKVEDLRREEASLHWKAMDAYRRRETAEAAYQRLREKTDGRRKKTARIERNK